MGSLVELAIKKFMVRTSQGALYHVLVQDT